MKYFALLSLLFIVLAPACTDPELDPFQLDKLKKASIIALRGDAAANLEDISFRGAVDKFSLSGDPATENFEFDAAFLSDDLNSLSQVEIYARRTETSNRVRIKTVPGSAFAIRTNIDRKYPSASISIPLTEILSALTISLADISSGEYLFIESDLNLTDGTQVSARDIVNNSLFESDIFYPAHKLRYLAVD